MLLPQQTQSAGDDGNAARQVETRLQALFHGSLDSEVHRLSGGERLFRGQRNPQALRPRTPTPAAVRAAVDTGQEVFHLVEEQLVALSSVAKDVSAARLPLPSKCFTHRLRKSTRILPSSPMTWHVRLGGLCT